MSQATNELFFTVQSKSKKRKIYEQYILTNVSLNDYILSDIYHLCKQAISTGKSNYIIDAYKLYHQINIQHYLYKKYYNEIIDILFHYEFSHGNIIQCENYLSMMRSHSPSYHRHYLKYKLLKWWIYDKTDLVNRVNDQNYQNILLEIYKMMDERRNEEKNNRNAFLCIRDHIFYFKIGLYVNSFQKMKHKCCKWFNLCNYDKSYEQKLLQRIHYIYEEFNDTGQIYLGSIFDNIDDNNDNVIRFNLI